MPLSKAEAVQLDFSAVGLGDFSDRSTDQPQGYNGKFHLGEGLLIEARIPGILNDRLGVEIGALHFKRSVGSISLLDGSETDIETEHLQVPLLVRYWFLPYLSAGFGAYYIFDLGSVTSVSVDTQGYVQQSYSDAGLVNYDYGLLGVVGGNIPITPWLSGLVDFRYALGLNNIDLTGQDNSKYRDFQILVGARFTIQTASSPVAGEAPHL